MPLPAHLLDHLMHLPLDDRHRLVCEAVAEACEAGVSLLRDDPENVASLQRTAQVWREAGQSQSQAPGGNVLAFRRPA